MKQFIDHYAVLGVSQQATPKELKAAYIKLSLRWHPDRNGRDTNRKMQGINEANRILSNTALREKYNCEYQRFQNIATNQAGNENPPKVNAKQKINYSCELKTDDDLIFICTNAAKYKLEYIHVVILELNKRNYSTDAIKELVKIKTRSNTKPSYCENWLNIFSANHTLLLKLIQSWKKLNKVWITNYKTSVASFLRSLLH